MCATGSSLLSSAFCEDRAWLGSSEMARQVRAFDWSETALGSIEAWPRSLTSAVALCLRSPFPMAIYWGPDLTCIYNDAEREMLGELHSRGLGMPARELLRDWWEVVGPRLAAVTERGEPTWAEDRPLMVDRRGKVEVSYFTYAFSPIIDDGGGVGGVLLVGHETTARVLAERRLKALRNLAEQSLDAPTVPDACTQCARALSQSGEVMLALVYVLDEGGERVTCLAAEANAQAWPESPPSVELAEAADEVSTLFAELVSGRSGGRLVPLSLIMPAVADGRGAPEMGFVAPMASGTRERLDGFLIVGVRDDLVFDRAYGEFLELAAMGVGRGIAAARNREAEQRRAAEIAKLDRVRAATLQNARRRTDAAAAQARVQERGRHDGELRALLNDLRAAQRRVVAAGDAERRRIERDLHDGAQQRLMAVRLELGLLEEQLQEEPHAAARQLAPLRRELDEALEELRELAHGLYPPLLASDGLEAALAAVGRRSPLPVRVEARGMVRAPRSIESTAYFCCIEALQNAVKHAGPGAQVTIKLAMRNHCLVFSVEDDGVGFDPELVRPGQGLVNLRDRLSGLGGSVEIRSAPGAGTSLAGEIPLS